MSCPICNHTELEEGAENCPKCGSDIEIFTHIENAHKSDIFQKKAMLSLVGVLGIIMVSWGSVSLFSGDNKEASDLVAVAETTEVEEVPVEDPLNISDAGKPVEEFVAENAEAKSEAASLKTEEPAKTSQVAAPDEKDPVEKAPAVKEKVKHAGPTFDADGYIYHKVRKGDSFWKISKRYFGSGKHAKRIAADNNLNPRKNIPLGTKLKINK